MTATAAPGDSGVDAVDPLVLEQRIALQSRRRDRKEGALRGLRRVVVFVVFLALIALAYTGYKAFGQAIDDAQTDWPLIGSFLPATNDLTMPPVGDILAAFGETPRAADQVYGAFLFEEALFTLREAVAGFVAGVIIGIGVAVLLLRSQLLERALLPYVILSQTIPLIAIAPIIVIWGRNSLDWLPFEWQDWMSVAVIATYLTFFPVAVNGLRGLHSAKPHEDELMKSYAASWTQSLWRLRFPASLPYLFAGFKIAATASVVGAIVGEISGGESAGLGRRILLEAQRYTSGPERLYASVLAAAALGLFVFVVVSGVERLVLSRQRREAVV